MRRALDRRCSLAVSLRRRGPEALVSLVEQLLCDGQVRCRRVSIDMTQERGQMHEPRVRVDALAIPAEQRGDGEWAAQVMESGRKDAWRNRQLQLGQKLMESLADCPRIDAATFCEGEQRHLRFALLAVTLFYVASEAIGQLGSERHDSALAELGFADK